MYDEERDEQLDGMEEMLEEMLEEMWETVLMVEMSEFDLLKECE